MDTIIEKYQILNSIKSHLFWDNYTYLPAGSIGSRSKQTEYLESATIELLDGVNQFELEKLYKEEKDLEQIVTEMGYDFKRGRIDLSLHPFCNGISYSDDIRFTLPTVGWNSIDSVMAGIT